MKIKIFMIFNILIVTFSKEEENKLIKASLKNPLCQFSERID